MPSLIKRCGVDQTADRRERGAIETLYVIWLRSALLSEKNQILSIQRMEEAIISDRNALVKMVEH